MRQFSQQILPAGLPTTTVWGYGAIKSATREGLLIHNAPSLTIEAKWNRPVRVKWINDLVDATATTCRTCCRSTRPCTGPTRPAARADGTPGRAFDRDPGPYTGPVPIVTHVHGAVGSAGRQRRLRRGLVPAGRCDNIPAGYADGRHLVRLLQGQGGDEVRGELGARVRHLPVPEHPARLDHLVPRPHAGHDPAERVRGAGGVLHHPRRAGGRQRRTRQPHRAAGRAARPGAQGGRQVPGEQGLLRDPDGHPGPLVQRRRVAVLPRHARVLRRHHRPIHPRNRHLADLEPGVLRQHDHGQRQHLAVPGRRAAPLPVPLPQRLRLPVPDPGLRRHPRGRGLADRQRGWLPPAPVNLTANHGNRLLLGLAERADIIVDFTNVSGRQLRPGQHRPGRAVRGGEPDWTSTSADPASTGQIMQFRVGPRAGTRPDHPAAVPGTAAASRRSPAARSPGRWPCSRRCRWTSPMRRPQPCWARSAGDPAAGRRRGRPTCGPSR